MPSVALAVPGAPIHGAKSGIGTTAVQIKDDSTRLFKGAQLKADKGNAGTIAIGGANVTIDTADATDGVPLEASEGLFVPADTLNTLWAVASEAGQKLHFIAV